MLATKLLHRSLKGLVVNSERIFIGKCISVQEGALELSRGRIYYTQYTFQVTEQIKGSVGRTISFRQYGLVKPRKVDETTALVKRVLLMPTYQEEREYVLFLGRDSRLGLTSPVGLHQGAFAIQRDSQGRKVASNGLMNRGLFKDLDPKEMSRLDLTQTEKNLTTTRKGAFPLRDFHSLVKKFARDYK